MWTRTVLLLATFGLLGSSKVALAQPKAGEERTWEIAKGVPMKFCWVPSGKATLGSPATEQDRDTLDEQEHEFETKGFWLAKYEVTQAQWEAVMGKNPSSFKGEKLPVDMVSWEDCQDFTKKCKVPGLEVRLPSEDEWEYACRGGRGNKQPFYWGNTLDGDKANCDGRAPYGFNKKGTYLDKTTEVGSYEKIAPHPWGLCDMHGNLWEWCDNLHSPKDTPQPVRGGSWSDESHKCRSAFRGNVKPNFSCRIIGLRLALAP